MLYTYYNGNKGKLIKIGLKSFFFKFYKYVLIIFIISYYYFNIEFFFF